MRIMKMSVPTLLAACGLLVSAAALAEPTWTAITSQGELRYRGTPLAGPVDFEFRLFGA